VFITDTCDVMTPDWLNIVKGMVDSEDFSWYISLETLQQNKILRVIKKDLVKKRLEMVAEHFLAHIRLQFGQAHAVRGPRLPHDQVGLGHRRRRRGFGRR